MHSIITAIFHHNGNSGKQDMYYHKVNILVKAILFYLLCSKVQKNSLICPQIFTVQCIVPTIIYQIGCSGEWKMYYYTVNNEYLKKTPN